jgi:hypothetical protein
MGQEVTLVDIYNSLRAYNSVGEYKFKTEILTQPSKRVEPILNTMKIYSRTYKNKLAQVDSLVLAFGDDGIAECDKSFKELVDVLMAFNPGHFEYVPEELSVEAAEPEVSEESNSSEPGAAEETESSDENTAPTKRGRKKV